MKSFYIWCKRWLSSLKLGWHGGYPAPYRTDFLYRSSKFSGGFCCGFRRGIASFQIGLIRALSVRRRFWVKSMSRIDRTSIFPPQWKEKLAPWFTMGAMPRIPHSNECNADYRHFLTGIGHRIHVQFCIKKRHMNIPVLVFAIKGQSFVHLAQSSDVLPAPLTRRHSVVDIFIAIGRRKGSYMWKSNIPKPCFSQKQSKHSRPAPTQRLIVIGSRLRDQQTINN